MAVHPRLVQPTIDFHDESEADALRRYNGFAQSVFDRLWALHPNLRSGFQFFRDSRSDDIWSFCDAGKREFGLQLDPDIEVICLWDGVDSVEIGTWAADPIADAVEWLSERCIET